MERNNDAKKLRVTAALVAAGVIGLTVQARGSRHTMSIDGAERALVYGQVDANWVRGASCLVQSHPELAARLAQISESGSIDDVRRGLALDALARAGTAPAQRALRQVLATPSVQADPIYPLLLTRLDSLTTPASPRSSSLAHAKTRHARSATNLHGRGE